MASVMSTAARLDDPVVGIDIGGTKTLALLCAGGEIRRQIRRPRPRGPQETIDHIIDIVAELTPAAGEPIAGLGVGIAGAISRAGSVQFSPNIPELVDFPLRDHLTAALDMPVRVENDATSATWAEHQQGAGQGTTELLYVALGTGIGTGLVLNGEVYRGAHGFAGEAGHIVIDRTGPTHISGVQGPWEMYASGNGLGALAREWAAAGRLPSLEGVGEVASIRGEHVHHAVTNGAPDAHALLDAFAEHVAVGITNLIYVLDPERIVLGGGLVDLGDALRERVQAQVDATTLGGEFRPHVPIVLAALGAHSAALGAAMLAARTLDN